MQFRVFCNALTVDCLEDFQRLIENELPLPFSHRILICGLGYITVENTVHTFRILNFGFPMEYLQAIRTADGGISSPVMQNWIKAGKPQLYNADTMATSLPES